MQHRIPVGTRPGRPVSSPHRNPSQGVGSSQERVVADLQRTMGNRAVAALLSGRPHPAPLRVQRIKDYDSSGVSRGTGLTPSSDGPHGPWHIHVILDEEGLGLVKQMFIKFEARPGAQHLMIDQDGNFVRTALYDLRDRKDATGDLVRWGMQQLSGFYNACGSVAATEIERRRREKADREERDRQALAKLAPIIEAKKHEYSGRQGGLFGSQATAISEDAATELLAKAGITKENNRDFMMLRSKVKNGEPKEQWASFIQMHYDVIYPPIVSSASSSIVSLVDEHRKEGTPTPKVEETSPPKVEAQEKPLGGQAVMEAVRTEIVTKGNPQGVGPALTRLGLSAVLIAMVIALLLRFVL